MQETLENEVVRESLAARYAEVRRYTLELTAPLKTEDFVPQAAEFASPPKWHLAHTTWFFEEFILKANKEGYTEFDSQFSFLFNSYYNAIGERTIRTDRGIITRPTVEQVKEYRAYVDQHIALLIAEGMDAALEQLLIIGMNHEQQHQELMITDMKYMFAQNPVFPVVTADKNRVGGKHHEKGWISITGGVREIGHQGKDFCYDNELGRHKVYLADYEIANGLVTNGQYMDFMLDEAYDRFDVWLDEGWAWVNENDIRSPLYWHRIDGAWMQYTLSGLQPVDPDAPLCHISYYEAEAFARWSGCRLPTEAEWEVASAQFDWGERWEWTGSAYLPYPGFKTAPGALGEYNGKFMVNQMVLRGASTATSSRHSRATYRNFFQAHHQWQFSGVRVVKS